MCILNQVIHVRVSQLKAFTIDCKVIEVKEIRS
jgi:hypothetical protein